MPEKSIIFSGSEVRAFLAGNKTQFRRAVRRVDNECNALIQSRPGVWQMHFGPHGAGAIEWCNIRSHYRPGDILWVKEAWFAWNEVIYWNGGKIIKPPSVCYKADGGSLNGERWKSPATMPRWASRLSLEVTDVRCYRLQDITEEDADDEGADTAPVANIIGACWSKRDAFAKWWNHLNLKRGHGWDSNPWVFAYTVRPVADTKETANA